MKKSLMVGAMLVLLGSSTGFSQTHEAVVGVAFVEAGDSGYEFPFYIGSVGAKVHLAGFDLGGGYDYGNFPKRGTPGGHRNAKSAFVNRWFGEHVYVGADWARIYGDATAWTKEVDFVGLNAGYRIIGNRRYEKEPSLERGKGWRHREVRGRHEDVISFSYDREVKTDAVAPNRSESFGAGWTHDFPVSGPLAVRSSIRWSYQRFDQYVDGSLERLGAPGVTFGIGIALKGSQ